MLSAVLWRRHFKDVSDAQQRLLRISIRHHLEYGEVLEDAIHHVFLGEMLEFVDEIDHVLAHGRAVDAVDEASVLEARVLGLHLLDDLFAERAHFRRTGDGHVLIALVLWSDGVEGTSILVDVGAQIGPEFDEEEGVLRTFVEEFLEAALLLREFVVDLSDVHRLEHGVRIHCWSADVHEQMLVVRIGIALLLKKGGEFNKA